MPSARSALCLLLLGLVHCTHEDDEWSEACDPWKVGRPVSAGDYVKCPPQQQSPSGCGDFLLDPRGKDCGAARLRLDNCSKRIMHFRQEPDQNQNKTDPYYLPLETHYHVCVDTPIKYIAERSMLPPVVNQHRERWPSWGHYDFLPVERWLHGLEHGAAVFLYDFCLHPEDICRLKSYVLGLAQQLSDQTGPFRWMLTPAPLGRLSSGTTDRKVGIVFWGSSYVSDCYNEADMTVFVRRHYRWTSAEDVASQGAYKYLLRNDSFQACEGFPVGLEEGVMDSTSRSTVTGLVKMVKEMSQRTQALEAELKELRGKLDNKDDDKADGNDGGKRGKGRLRRVLLEK